MRCIRIYYRCVHLLVGLSFTMKTSKIAFPENPVLAAVQGEFLSTPHLGKICMIFTLLSRRDVPVSP